MTKFILLVSLSISLSGCISLFEGSQTKKPIKYIGWYYDQCLVIKAPDLSRGTVVILVDAEATENRLLSQIISPAKKSDKCPPLAEDRVSVNAENGKNFYLISKLKAAQAGATFNFGIAVVVLGGENDSLPISGALDLNNDGVPDTFSSCATSEGISFDIWSATPYKSKNLWNGYYYLGYDIDSNCPDI